MAVFSYNDDLDANRDKVRFWLQDTVKSKGPKPANGNFSDQEINGLITIEETWQRAVAGRKRVRFRYSMASLRKAPRQVIT
jgi:hypothetical protein